MAIETLQEKKDLTETWAKLDALQEKSEENAWVLASAKKSAIEAKDNVLGFFANQKDVITSQDATNGEKVIAWWKIAAALAVPWYALYKLSSRLFGSKEEKTTQNPQTTQAPQIAQAQTQTLQPSPTQTPQTPQPTQAPQIAQAQTPIPQPSPTQAPQKKEKWFRSTLRKILKQSKTS